MANSLSNKQRITIVSFLAYFILSGMLAPIGIIAGPMAALFDQPITDVVARFSWLTLGNLAGAVLALFMFDWISLKRLMLILYSVILISLLSFNISTDLTAIGLALGLVGLCSGLGLAGAALTISKSYDTEKRVRCSSSPTVFSVSLASYAAHWRPGLSRASSSGPAHINS